MKRKMIEMKENIKDYIFYLCVQIKEKQEKRKVKIFSFSYLIIKKSEKKENFIQFDYTYIPTIIEYIVLIGIKFENN